MIDSGEEGALAAVHAPQNIRQYLDGPLAPLWNSRHLSVGQLWQHYTAHPYLPRLRDRAVLDDAILAVLSAVTWEIDGFALAQGTTRTRAATPASFFPTRARSA